MPIIIAPNQADRIEPLLAAGAAVMTTEQSMQQDIRPARIGLLNLMPAPAMRQTESQWLRFMSRTVLQIEPVFVKFDDDPRDRSGGTRADILQTYTSFSKVQSEGLDGLIVTGDNLELDTDTVPRRTLLPFDRIKYAPHLRDVIDWSRENVRSTIYSCLASHFALDYLFGLERELSPEKVFGVYDHMRTNTNSSLLADMDDTIRAPHSRWGNIPTESMQMAVEVEVLADGDPGWLVASAINNNGGEDVFIQGHPEYNRNDLDDEYSRDKLNPPAHYYDALGKPVLSWSNDARTLHANWIDAIYQHFSRNS